MTYVRWTPHLIWRLAIMFEDGAPFSAIGEALGISRSACIAKANRLGMRRR